MEINQSKDNTDLFFCTICGDFLTDQEYQFNQDVCGFCKQRIDNGEINEAGEDLINEDY